MNITERVKQLLYNRPVHIICNCVKCAAVIESLVQEAYDEGYDTGKDDGYDYGVADAKYEYDIE